MSTETSERFAYWFDEIRIMKINLILQSHIQWSMHDPNTDRKKTVGSQKKNFKQIKKIIYDPIKLRLRQSIEASYFRWEHTNRCVRMFGSVLRVLGLFCVSKTSILRLFNELVIIKQTFIFIWVLWSWNYTVTNLIL